MKEPPLPHHHYHNHHATDDSVWNYYMGQPLLRRVVAGLGMLLLVSTTTLHFLQPDTPLPASPVIPLDSQLRLLQDNETLQCSQECCIANYSDILPCEPEEESTADNPFAQTPLWFQIVLMIFLIIMSAFFSGLTLGIMGLDKTGLEIVMEGDDARYREYAARIYPLRQRGNLLLCTLLLGNVCVNSLLSILTADKFGGTIGLLSSTFLIVIFGEIVPQAACQRYSLEVGSTMAPVMRVVMYLLFPVAYPLSKGLDFALGEELATTYSSSEMIKLLQIHVNEQIIDSDTATAMKGALKYKDMTVKEVMTPLANVFMLSAEERLNFETIAKIFKTGYSRIPVYHVSKNNVIGLLFVKDLIFIDPEDATLVQDFVDIFGRGVHTVWPDDKLGEVLRDLKQGKSHMALVKDVNNEDESKDPFYEVKGIITLEDVIEEIIGVEIVDETDEYVDGTHSARVDRDKTFKWASLRLLDSKIVDETLSFEETQAVTAHLLRNYHDVVSLLTEAQLEHLIATTPVSVLPTATQEVGKAVPDDLMYEKNKPNDVCTLILSGKVKVLAGADNFRTDVSSWAVLASKALVDQNYKPDFTAFVSSGPCRCLRLTRARFWAAVDSSALERQGSSAGIMTSGASSPALSLSRKESVSSASSNLGAKTRKEKLITALKAVEQETEGVIDRRAVKAASISRQFDRGHDKLKPVSEDARADHSHPNVPIHDDGEALVTASEDTIADPENAAPTNRDEDAETPSKQPDEASDVAGESSKS